jgi:capsular polysaccharide biosynthesis protein
VWFVPALRAIYKDNGELVHASILKRGTRMCNIPPLTIDVKQFAKTDIIDKAFFGGIMLGKHHGHFLIESLSRLWPLAIPDMADDLLGCKILYWSQDKTTVPVEKAVIRPAQLVLESLRIKSNISILGQPVYISELIIPDQASILNHEFYSVFRDLLKLAGTGIVLKHRQSQNNNRYPEKVYLSRTKLPYYRRNNGNERRLESILKGYGFEIIHPQEFSLPDQICIFNKAKVIVGSFGSAFHTMLLAEISDQRILCLVDDCPDLTSTGIDRICNAKTEYIRCMYPHPFCIKESGSGATKDKIIDVDRALNGISLYV